MSPLQFSNELSVLSWQIVLSDELDCGCGPCVGDESALSLSLAVHLLLGVP